MIGNTKWNLWFGLVGSVLTFLFSFFNNPLSTALMRSVYCFIILFLFTFAIRLFLGSVAGLSTGKEDEEMETDDEGQPGQLVDESTPDEADEIREALKQNLHSETTASNKEPEANKHTPAPFSPLDPPKLATDPKRNPEQLADAVRQMSNPEGR